MSKDDKVREILDSEEFSRLMEAFRNVPKLYRLEAMQAREKAKDFIANKLQALYKPEQGKIEKILEGYKFPIFTETNEYGDSEEVTREDLAKAIAEEINDKTPYLVPLTPLRSL